MGDCHCCFGSVGHSAGDEDSDTTVSPERALEASTCTHDRLRNTSTSPSSSGPLPSRGPLLTTISGSSMRSPSGRTDACHMKALAALSGDGVAGCWPDS